ncbi:MAG: tRNA 2-thiocytidine(32) synthetase TtcA [Anaeromyxobacter sp.]|nr:tRNA 2-thiocytidine(32) synthetase TtcA [Anaeromyxobacter sp.]MBL0277424.1 tRNA 2-thiocytidine(32) synthetase TtcA [Anaeromyxobacter sp.]
MIPPSRSPERGAFSVGGRARQRKRKMQEVERLERRITRAAAQAIADFGLVEAGDRILVGCSGGKDSYTLLHVLMRLQARAPIRFDLVAVNLDQGQPGYPAGVVEGHFQRVRVPYRMVSRPLWSEVQRLVRPGKTPCSICARLRRGVLYNVAVEEGCTKIALGHHRDDFVETLLLNALYAGSLKAMPALLRSADGRNTVIRPLVYAAEEDIAAFAALKGFPIVPCDVCGAQPQLRRRRVKALLAELSAEHAAVKGNLLNALGKVMPAYLLDRGLAAQVAAGTGLDPWIDSGEEEEGATDGRVSLPSNPPLRKLAGP